MARASHVCPTPQCPTITTGGRCDTCKQRAEQRRGTASARGYGLRHRVDFRSAVLDRDPTCVMCKQRPSLIADHYPMSRRQLETVGLDPNDPQYGRGLCRTCDSSQTAQRQPGGWNMPA